MRGCAIMRVPQSSRRVDLPSLLGVQADADADDTPFPLALHSLSNFSSTVGARNSRCIIDRTLNPSQFMICDGNLIIGTCLILPFS
ncbi:hypothetical protein ACHAXM_009390 [Skeletonema potamos]